MHQREGRTIDYIFNLLFSDYYDEYGIREKLIRKYPQSFTHRTRLSVIRKYYLKRLKDEIGQGLLTFVDKDKVRYYSTGIPGENVPVFSDGDTYFSMLR